MVYLKSRTRYTTGSYIDGTTGAEVPVVSESAQDNLVTSIRGRGVDHVFEAAHGWQSGSIMNGQLGSISNFIGCPAAFYSGTPFYNGLSVSRANIDTLLAVTNPSRPEVLLPVFLKETIHELPDMLRQAGRIAKRIYFLKKSWRDLVRPDRAVRDAAVANLVIQFGWRPFVSDLWKIATLQDQVEKRRKELNRLHSGKGLKRSVTLGSDSLLQTGSAQVWSSHGIGATVPTRTVHSIHCWGTARWRPTSGIPPWKPTNGELRRQLFGLSADAILTNLWEGLPWSWLIDWFIPIGDHIVGGNRTVATPVSACIMTERKTTVYYDGRKITQNASRPWSITPGSKVSVIRQRSIMGASPPSNATASFPTLGANQLSILGSLAILRVR